MRLFWLVASGIGYLAGAAHAWYGLANYDETRPWLIVSMLIVSGINQMIDYSKDRS